MLTKNLERAVKEHPRQLAIGPAKAGQIYYNGAIVGVDAAGLIVRGIIGAVRIAGVLVEPLLAIANFHLDNSAGSDGAWSGGEIARGVRFDTVGEYAFAVSGDPKPGGKAYAVDDETVSALPTAAGLVLGEFSRPHTGGRWFVDIGQRNTPVRSAVTLTVGAAAAGAQAVDIQAVDEHGDDLPLALDVLWFLASDAAGLVRSATAADGGVAATIGSASETVAGVEGTATLTAAGAGRLVVDHSGPESFRLTAIVVGSGRRTVSTIITPTP